MAGRDWLVAFLAVAVVGLLCVAGGANAVCDNMAASFDAWYCEPCGGYYDCTVSGSIENQCVTYEVPGCVLPPDAANWFCCRDCTVYAAQVCEYIGTGSGNDTGPGQGSASSASGIYYEPPVTAIYTSALGIVFIVILFSLVALAMRRARLRRAYEGEYQTIIYQQPQPGQAGVPYQGAYIIAQPYPQPYQQYQQLPAGYPSSIRAAPAPAPATAPNTVPPNYGTK